MRASYKPRLHAQLAVQQNVPKRNAHMRKAGCWMPPPRNAKPNRLCLVPPFCMTSWGRVPI